MGVVCSLTLNLDNSAAARMLRHDLGKWQLQLGALESHFPTLKKERQTSELLGQILRGANWRAKGVSVQTQIRISARTWQELCEALTRISQIHEAERNRR